MIQKSVFGLLFFLGFLVSLPSLAQIITYTSNGSGGWIRNPNVSGCSIIVNHPLQTPIAGTSSCLIQIIINHNITLASLNLGSNAQLIINANRNLTVTGNITVAAETTNSKITVNGGNLIINQNLILVSGKSNGKTNFSLETNSNGSVEILDNLNTQKAIEVRNEVIFTITGDGSGVVQTKSLDLGQKSEINILSSGDLIVTNSVKFSGNNSEINVSGGLVVQGNVEVTGGSGNQLNSYGNSKTIIEEDLIVSGNSDVTFGGTSVTDIGRDIVINGASKVIATDDAIVFVCGTFPAPCSSCGTQELVKGVFNPGCRILPVELIHLSATFDAGLRITKIHFTTAKERENSHFEVERSVNDANSWIKIGEVTGKGYSDLPVEYAFNDLNLPASGGNIFYRLKQIDLDGDFQYSVTRAIQVEALDGITSWIAYPNPSIMGSTITLALIEKIGIAEGKIQITISDHRGITQTYTVLKPEDVSAAINSHLENARPGMYITQIFWGSKSEQIKLIRK